VHIVLASIAFKLSQKFKAEGLVPPTFQYASNDIESTNSGVPFLVLSDPESDMYSAGSAGMDTDQTATLILVHQTDLEASQMARVITKYIGQDKMSLELVNGAGQKIGQKNIDRISTRPMANESDQRYGISIMVEWVDREFYPEVDSILLVELNVDVQE